MNDCVMKLSLMAQLITWVSVGCVIKTEDGLRNPVFQKYATA